MSPQDLIDYVRSLPKAEAEKQVRRFLLDFIGENKRGDILRNRYKRELRRKAREL